MKIEITYDNEQDGKAFLLKSDDLIILNVKPFEVREGRIATYVFPELISEDDVIEALDKFQWCFTGLSEIKDSPTP